MLDKQTVSSPPHVTIVSQPSLSPSHSQGPSSVLELRDLPEIVIVGSSGPALVVVSCVDHDKDRPRAHPHNLVGGAQCRQGVCVVKVKSSASPVKIQQIGIQRVGREEIRHSLKQRKHIRVDPFLRGFEHGDKSVDLTAIKLCFQVFLENPQQPGKFTEILKPVCSKVICTLSENYLLKIKSISDIFTPVAGGKKMIILCEKINPDDIAVRFYDGDLGNPWQAMVQPSLVHKDCALVLRTPQFVDGCAVVETIRKVFVTLVRPSDGMSSEPVEMFYVPPCADGPSVTPVPSLVDVDLAMGQRV
eukprot:GFUD01002682.1.p1 GENE.GFUD01002682.1~~GFUD01002682.1.p1  ORF type:complete len:303 (+),score=89.17 GFUD01002682.1:196-1104(+)